MLMMSLLRLHLSKRPIHHHCGLNESVSRLMVFGDPLDRLVLSLYVEPMVWAKPMKYALALDQESALALINY